MLAERRFRLAIVCGVVLTSLTAGTARTSHGDRAGARALVDEGRSLELAGDPSEALDRFERAIASDPDYLPAYDRAAWLWIGWRRAEREGEELRRTLSARQAERDAWRASAEHYLAGLAQAIDRQFGHWNLTPAEREVALQVLKGRSHKEIAAATGRSERTVRQHAASAYHKAGLEGRAALAAYFLDGLSAPSREAGHLRVT